MTNQKIYAIVSIPIGLLFLFWLFTWAFDMISAPSNTCVFLGVLLACIGLFILFKLIQFLLKTFMP
ncbi:MAG: hypothetical protein EOO50_11620 [Flavobacterium sp.]|nr:MAG: hypothetical protein EOO50_11620 [Flavobacterium sp.]